MPTEQASQSRSTLAYNGMVAAPHALASSAGLAALQEGGSAMDAALAANAVLTVVYPDQTAIGGDCFFIAFDARTKQLHGYNGSGRTPLTADADHLRELEGGCMPKRGIHAVTVPGTIDAWAAGHRRFGRLPWDRVLQPATDYAHHGFAVSARLAGGISAVQDFLASDDLTASTYLKGGAAPREGDQLRLPDLARTLATIAVEGRDAFYSGAIAEEIAATAALRGGALSMYDLAGHRGEWVNPLSIDYHGLTVAGLPPNSQGLTSLIGLNMLKHVDLGEEWGGADHIHPLIEVKKFAFAVRDEMLSDPRFTTIDTAKLISSEYAEACWRHYDPTTAAAGTPSLAGDTVAICAVDRDGNAVSLIQSIYQGFGSGVMAGETGIVLQNRGSYFSLEPDHPNVFEPGKRPLHTLMPAMLLRDGELVGPLGTQGGDAQAQVHLQLVTDLVDFAMMSNPAVAIDAPRWIAGGASADDPRTVQLENRFSSHLADDLVKRGHRPQWTGAWNPAAGHAQVILRDHERGLLAGAADPRADGAALGY
ncbi:MAG: gamma-glutamyltransferase [Thermomicrobiales bacterium]